MRQTCWMWRCLAARRKRSVKLIQRWRKTATSVITHPLPNWPFSPIWRHIMRSWSRVEWRRKSGLKRCGKSLSISFESWLKRRKSRNCPHLKISPDMPAKPVIRWKWDFIVDMKPKTVVLPTSEDKYPNWCRLTKPPGARRTWGLFLVYCGAEFFYRLLPAFCSVAVL